MAVKKTLSLAEQLRIIADAAPSLRAAGVTRVGADGSFTLAPADRAAPTDRDPPPAAPDDVDLGNVSSFRRDRGVS